jgi:hypothetical protein
LLARLQRFSLPDSRLARRATTSTALALAVAAISMLMLGVGGWLWWWRSDLGDLPAPLDLRGVFMRSVLFGGAASFCLWLAWLVVSYITLQGVTGATMPMSRWLREAGFATAPLALGVLMVVPLISFGVGVLAIGACVAATQSALERASGFRGFAVVLANTAGFAVWAFMLSLLATGGNALAPGPFVAETLWEAVATGRR